MKNILDSRLYQFILFILNLTHKSIDVFSIIKFVESDYLKVGPVQTF